MSEPTPVFVIGMTRSGTKWLSNILCNHSEMIGVQSERHGGILETNMLNVMSCKFDLTSVDDYVAFIHLWSQSDFYRLTGAEKHRFFEKPWSFDSLEIYTTLMCEYAERDGKRFWVQKTDPECGLKLLSRIPTAHFVVIERNFLDRIISTLQLQGNKGRRPSVFDAVYDTIFQIKTIKRILKKKKVFRVSYEDLRCEAQSIVKSTCDHIGVAYEPEMLDVKYQKNTSFRGRQHPKTKYAKQHALRLRLMAIAINLIPLFAMRWFRILKSTVSGKPPPGFVSGTFSELTDELTESQITVRVDQ